MSQRLLSTSVLLFLTSCLAGTPPPSAAAPSGGQASSAECGQFKIQSRSDLDSCKGKCSDQQRDQMKSCSGPGCQAGAATAVCMGSCDDGQKAAQTAKCYKD